MLFNLHKKLVSHLLNYLVDEVMTYQLGFGKMEKMRAVGRTEAISEILEYCGVSSVEIKRLRDKTIETAEANLIHYGS